MDTRAPPITSRTQEKHQQHQNQKQKQQRQKQHEEVTLPPLAPFSAQNRHRAKFASAPNWRNGVAAPGVLKHQDIQRRRPYKVLGIGATPLMHACQQGDRPRVLALLREQEETIGYRDRALRSALHYCMDAATGGAVAQAAPELVDAPDAEGHTALHLAVIAGDAQLVAVLLANGANVNAKDLEGHSVLHWATVCGEVECVRLVLAAGAQPSSVDFRGGSPLHYAAQCCGAAATVELSIPKKLGLKVLQTLLEFGADVNARDEDGRQPILWAASAGSVEAVLALVRAGGSGVASASDKDGLTALHCAASRGHARCIEALVNLCDAQPDQVDDNGCSPLHYAATLGHADATALLLKLGADPNRQDRKGRTPALCAAAKGQLESLKILAQHGASLHARTVRGMGIAHEAVASGRLELVKWLAKRRPSLLDMATQDGKTPLHVAALHGYLDVCKILLDSGARVNTVMRSSKGTFMTALDAALYRGHRDCAKLIQLHGGTTSQYLKSHKADSSKAFTAKARLKHTETSSDSELNEVGLHRHHHHHHYDPELYYEERWIERRTRRRANRRRLSRQDSRSFSEEELRHSKASSKAKPSERQRRALSENARYEGDETASESDHHEYDEDGIIEIRGRRRRKSEIHTKRKKDEANESESEDRSRSSKSDEESSSVSIDSLEVVVVKRSLETKCEKIVSGKKSKITRDVSKNIKDSSKANKNNSKKALKKQENKNKTEKSSKKRKSEILDRKASKQEQKDKDADNASQSTMERVTVTADVHNDEVAKTSEDKSSNEPKGEESERKGEEQMRNRVDDILGKADELQNALMAKAADLKKDMEEMRSQMSQKPDENEKKEKDESKDEVDKKIEEEDAAAVKSKSEEEITSTPTAESATTEMSNVTKDGSKSETSLDNNNASIDKKPADSEHIENKEISEKKDDVAKANEEAQKVGEKLSEDGALEKNTEDVTSQQEKRGSIEHHEGSDSKRKSILKDSESTDTRHKVQINEETLPSNKDNAETVKTQEVPTIQICSTIPGTEGFRFADETSSSSPTSGKAQTLRRSSRPSTGTRRSKGKFGVSGRSEDRSPDRSAIVAVIESPAWDEEDDEELDKEIRQVVGNMEEEEEEQDEEDDEEESDGIGGDDGLGIVRVLPSTSEEEMATRTSAVDSLPQLPTKSQTRAIRLANPEKQQYESVVRRRTRQRRDSGGRDSGIEPSPRVSRIPRRNVKCCPITERQQALNINTVTRDVQINMRRYHLERKIFFQLMELKRLQIRHGRSNEQVLVKRQVDAFHKAGMSGPALGVTRYDHQPYTFRHFESFLYEQLRKLQRRPTTPDWCTEAKHCTQKTHRCHHATSAYTSVPTYTYLGGDVPERPSLLPKIEGRGKGQMTVEVTRGEEKQVIALPSENLDRAKKYYVTFTVRGETTDSEKSRSPTDSATQRNTKSV